MPEQLPSQEEIKSIFETILQGKEYKEARLFTDERGVRLYEIEITLENGDKVEYNYERSARDYRDETIPAGERFSASIHTIRYDEVGVPVSGECIANCFDGTWKYYV